MPTTHVALILLLVGAVFAHSPHASASHFGWLGHAADVPSGATPIGEFSPTFYRILDEAAPEWSRGEKSEPLLTRDGKLIARVTAAFKTQLDVEGSARLRDRRVVNIEERVQGRMRYLVVRNAPFGVGEPGFKLMPYRTVAVDPRRIALGTVLYLPALAGVPLPSGEIHDGFCFAHDTGHGISGNRIDVFVGFENDRVNALTRSGRIASHEPVRVFRVEGATARAIDARFRKAFASGE